MSTNSTLHRQLSFFSFIKICVLFNCFSCQGIKITFTSGQHITITSGQHILLLHQGSIYYYYIRAAYYYYYYIRAACTPPVSSEIRNLDTYTTNNMDQFVQSLSPAEESGNGEANVVFVRCFQFQQHTLLYLYCYCPTVVGHSIFQLSIKISLCSSFYNYNY